MNDDVEINIIVSIRVDDLPIPAVKSSKHPCTECEMDVWVDVNLIDHMEKWEKTYQIMCVHCGVQHMGVNHEKAK